jgi:hypothetical protein
VDDPRSILVITSCTNLKAIGKDDRPLSAEDLYRGEQHRRLMRGVHSLRSSDSGLELDLWIVSAGYGLVHGEDRLGFYDASFAGLRKGEIERRALALGIPAELEALLARPSALNLLLLGDDYLTASGLSPSSTFNGPTLFFCASVGAERLAGADLVVVPAGKAEARRFSCGLVGLKGELAARLLELLAGNPALINDLVDAQSDILALLESPSQLSLAETA